MAHLSGNPPRIVIFLDADQSDDPSQMPSLVAPLESGAADLVIGSRVLGQREPGALTHHARFGNTFATLLISHGESIKYVSRQMGHASIQITADTYGHLFRETSIAAMGRLDARVAAVEAAKLAIPDDAAEMPAHVM